MFDQASAPSRTTSRIVEWALKTRLSEISINFRTTWDLYLKFYTVFLTFNVAALAWFFSSAHNWSSKAKWLIAGVFIMESVIVALTSAKIALYSGEVRRAISETVAELENMASREGEAIEGARIGFKTSLPLDIGAYSAWANFVGVLFVAVIWFVLAYLLVGS